MSKAYYANAAAGDDAYKAKATEYAEHNTDPSYEEVTLYAALSLYGSAVNITKTDKGSTVSAPMKIGTTGKIEKKPCNP